MELTGHGSERIQSRTKMLTKDVLSIITGGAVVNLGSDNGYEYLLFYSPPDDSTKIAVVADNREHLISIWNGDFVLPTGLLRVNYKRKEAAKKALATFILKESKKARTTPQTKKTPNGIAVKIQVKVDRKAVFVQDCGEYPSDRSTKREYVLSLLWPQLEPIVRDVEMLVKEDGQRKQVCYDLCLFRQKTSQCFKVHTITHTKMRGRLQAA
jgi:hypothetical protein